MKRFVHKRAVLGSLCASTAIVLATAQPAMAQASDPFIGQLALVGFNFCPRGWAAASGQILPIAQYTALFSLLGTTYGGNGQTTFALPDLRGRVPVSQGQGPGLSSFSMGQAAGTENVTLTINQMPAHSHAINATNEQANKGGPGDKLLAADANLNKYSDTPDPNRTMNPKMVGNTGGNQPFSVRDPYLTLQWCIALEGIYPSRN